MMRLSLTQRSRYRESITSTDGEEICILLNAVDSQGGICGGVTAIWMDLAQAKLLVSDLSELLLVTERVK
jgi:hypothetical protein